MYVPSVHHGSTDTYHVTPLRKEKERGSKYNMRSELPVEFPAQGPGGHEEHLQGLS
jgi:hypothetical protein